MNSFRDSARSGGICVMGRRAFGTGIGHLSESLLELLSRKYQVDLWDIHSRPADGETVTLSTGRQVGLAQNLDGYQVYIYADVLWNGVNYTRFTPPPADGYRIAYLAFDSDKLPPEWVEILNEHFDAVFFTSAHLIEVARLSGVTCHVGALPLAIPTEQNLSRPYRPVAGGRVRFGTLSSYHRRKGLDHLVSAFLAEFADNSDVELVIHSNIAFGETAQTVASMVEVAGADNVRLSTDNLSEVAKNQLLESFDVYVNASLGEGYSVGPREALSFGKVLAITDLGSHRPLFGPPGVFSVKESHKAPAIYPEIDNRQFGMQQVPDAADLRRALRDAYNFAKSQEAAATANERKRLGAEFTLQALERSYWALVDPDSQALGGRHLSSMAALPDTHTKAVREKAGRHGTRIGARHLVVPAHDGGFFSLYNAFVSHLVWSKHDSPQRLVLPDWDAGRLLERVAPKEIVSYCYSGPRDGNLWNHLFEPLYDLTAEELDDEDFLWGHSDPVQNTFNESREPLLTYVHAFRLYQDPDYQRIRKQYASVIADQVRLKAKYQSELDEHLIDRKAGRFLIAAHVKHPSHAVEQPDFAIADRHRYVALVRDELKERGISEASDDWAVFLATEQQRVVELFTEEFGDHVIRFPDVERIPTTTDLKFDQLDEDQKIADGHQLQHILAQDTSRWSPRLAWEVIRDAKAMASADVLLHAVSNVATAASLLEPRVAMKFAHAQ